MDENNIQTGRTSKADYTFQSVQGLHITKKLTFPEYERVLLPDCLYTQNETCTLPGFKLANLTSGSPESAACQVTLQNLGLRNLHKQARLFSGERRLIQYQVEYSP